MTRRSDRYPRADPTPGHDAPPNHVPSTNVVVGISGTPNLLCCSCPARISTATGSNALGQYAPAAARIWDEHCLRYQSGVDTVRTLQKSWDSLAGAGAIDTERHQFIATLLRGQEREARIWRDVCTQYFATFSQLPLPAGVESPTYKLADLRKLRAPFSIQ